MLWLSCPDGTLVYGQWHVQVCPRSTEFYMSPFIRSRLIHCISAFPTGNGYEGTRRPKWEFVELPARASLSECSNFEFRTFCPSYAGVPGNLSLKGNHFLRLTVTVRPQTLAMTNPRLTLWSFVILCFALSLVDAVRIQIFPNTISRSWAQYSPYFAVEKYQPPPRNCKVIQVSVLTSA